MQHSPNLDAALRWPIEHEIVAEALDWSNPKSGALGMRKITELTCFAVRDEKVKSALRRI